MYIEKYLNPELLSLNSVTVCSGMYPEELVFFEMLEVGFSLDETPLSVMVTIEDPRGTLKFDNTKTLR